MPHCTLMLKAPITLPKIFPIAAELLDLFGVIDDPLGSYDSIDMSFDN